MLSSKTQTKKIFQNVSLACVLILCAAFLFQVVSKNSVFAVECAEWDQKVFIVNDNGSLSTEERCLYGTDKTTGKIVSEDRKNPATSASSIRSDALRFIQYALGFLALVGVAMIIYGGFVWITSSGNETLVTKARKILIAAAIGLLVITVAWIIVSFVVKTATDALG